MRLMLRGWPDTSLPRHHRPCAGDPNRLKRSALLIRVAGTSPAITSRLCLQKASQPFPIPGRSFRMRTAVMNRSSEQRPNVTALGEFHDDGIDRQAVAFLGVDLGNGAVPLGAQHILHLHPLDDA